MLVRLFWWYSLSDHARTVFLWLYNLSGSRCSWNMYLSLSVLLLLESVFYLFISQLALIKWADCSGVIFLVPADCKFHRPMNCLVI